MMDKGFQLNKAVLNNIAWCEVVCHTHGIDCVWRQNLWGMHTEAPPFYPEVITVNKEASLEDVKHFIENGNVRSIKDSYAHLDFSPFGFKKIFDAEWICYPPDSSIEDPQTNWRAIKYVQDLAKWMSQSGLVGVIKPSLLEYENVRIFSIEGDGWISGFVTNFDAGVVGVSNVFSVGKYDERLWREIPRIISNKYPGMVIVGYEHGDDLHLANNSGWESLGPLRVWIRSE